MVMTRVQFQPNYLSAGPRGHQLTCLITPEKKKKEKETKSPRGRGGSGGIPVLPLTV